MFGKKKYFKFVFFLDITKREDKNLSSANSSKSLEVKYEFVL